MTSLGSEPQQKDDGGKGGRTVAIDFDGVLHAYSKGWHDGTIYDRPIEGSHKALLEFQAQAWKMVVFTARAELDDIRAWLARSYPDVTFADVTNDKPIAALYIDDRAIRFEDWDQAMGDVSALVGLARMEDPRQRRAYEARTVRGRCPACGHESLFLNDQGYVTCGYLTCEKPEAIADLLEFDQHFVTFTAGGWSIEHSLICRVRGDMARGCRYQQAIVEVYGDSDDSHEQGRWEITSIDGEGLPSLTRAPA